LLVWLNGGFGVDIFFIISGFVMMLTAPAFARRVNGTWDFALRRIVRVAPLYWAATTAKLVVLLLAPAVVLHTTLDWPYVVKSYLFLPAYAEDGSIAPLLAVGWTLLFEMFFYLLLTVALALGFNLFNFSAAVLLACAAGSLFVPERPPAYLMYLNPLVLEFLLGMAFARWATKASMGLATSVGLSVVGTVIIIAFPGDLVDRVGIVRAIGPALLVLGVVGLERHVRRFPPALVFLGAASYSLYLMHPLIAPLGPAMLSRVGLVWPVTSVLLCVILSLSAGVAVFVLFERPITIRLGRLVRRR
jgi:peptidoglycan/LPS O-acetylase OafA/YrhL